MTRTITLRSRSLATGFITGYLIFGIALLAIVVSTLSVMTLGNSDQVVFSTRRDEIIADAITIRTAILNCAILLPAGNNGDATTGAPQFPATAPDGGITNLRCPGTATIDRQSEALTIWQQLTRSGAASLSVPGRRIGMSAWQYVNRRNADGSREVFFFIEAASADDARSESLLQSVVRSRKLNLRPDAAPADLLFRTETVTSPTGVAVTRLRSRNLIAP